MKGNAEAVGGAVDGTQREEGEARRAVSLSPLQRIIADNILAVEGPGAAAAYVSTIAPLAIQEHQGVECGHETDIPLSPLSLSSTT